MLRFTNAWQAPRREQAHQLARMTRRRTVRPIPAASATTHRPPTRARAVPCCRARVERVASRPCMCPYARGSSSPRGDSKGRPAPRTDELTWAGPVPPSPGRACSRSPTCARQEAPRGGVSWLIATGKRAEPPRPTFCGRAQQPTCAQPERRGNICPERAPAATQSPAGERAARRHGRQAATAGVPLP